MKKELDLTLGIDGGVNVRNITKLAEKGIEHFAIATGIFAQEDPVSALKELKGLLNSDSG